MAGFINIGFGNIVNRDKIVAVVSPDAAPVKRMVQQGKEEKIVIRHYPGTANKSSTCHPGRISGVVGITAGYYRKASSCRKNYRRKR